MTYGPRKRICISFDWHNDKHYRNLLTAFANHPNNPIEFDDLTPGAIDTNDVARVKGVLTTRIKAATHTLVIIGQHANDRHKDGILIGTRNWIWWEIEQSKIAGNKLVAVKISSSNSTPDPLYNANTAWANSYKQDEILKAINAS